eukprot:3567348-Pleurochrysis_carterae.AAC.4
MGRARGGACRGGADAVRPHSVQRARVEVRHAERVARQRRLHTAVVEHRLHAHSHVLVRRVHVDDAHVAAVVAVKRTVLPHLHAHLLHGPALLRRDDSRAREDREAWRRLRAPFERHRVGDVADGEGGGGGLPRREGAAKLHACGGDTQQRAAKGGVELDGLLVVNVAVVVGKYHADTADQLPACVAAQHVGREVRL